MTQLALYKITFKDGSTQYESVPDTIIRTTNLWEKFPNAETIERVPPNNAGDISKQQELIRNKIPKNIPKM